MTDELNEITQFLAQVIPFNALSPQQLHGLARRMTLDYLPSRKSGAIHTHDCLYILRTGAVEVRTPNNELVDRLGEYECFGVTSLLDDNPNNHQVFVIEDALTYVLPKEAFLDLLQEYPLLSRFFRKLVDYRAHVRSSGQRDSKLDIQHQRSVIQLLSHAIVSCSPQDSIQHAATVMREHKVSCLLLMDDQTLMGIVTDRDLRNRVVADGKPLDSPVVDVATCPAKTLSDQASILEAQLMMSQLGVHHLPVVTDTGVVKGVVTASDLVRSHNISVVHLVDRIFRGHEVEQIAAVQHDIPKLLDYWVQADVNAQEIGLSFAVIGDAFVRKALQMAQQEIAEMPIDFAWLSFGSQARRDQSFASDQDNGLILASEPTDEQDSIIQSVCERTCELLDQFGYVKCPGNIMASNPQWRMTIDQWQRHYQDWVDEPDPSALLNASIFFDMRLITGPSDWLETLKSSLLAVTNKSDLFFFLMAQNAVRTKPPLGFFRDFIVNAKGDHEDELDIKQRGIALINDIARLVALHQGITDAGTLQRLQKIDDDVFSHDINRNLQEAWLLLNEIKLEQQSIALRSNTKPHNFVNPEQLSPLRRAHLKNVFKSIERAQKSVAHYFMRGAGA